MSSPEPGLECKAKERRGEERKSRLTESSLDLAGLASYKQVDAVVLVGEDVEEGILKLEELVVAAAGHRHGLALSGCCLVLDEALDIVVVDVVCGGESVPTSNIRIPMSTVQWLSGLTVTPCGNRPLT